MNNRFCISLVVLISVFTMNAQNKLNDAGEKTGYWKGYYPDSTLRYEAYFKNGDPVGTMKRYDSNGILSATMNFYPGSDRCFVNMYAPAGHIKAQGVYQVQQKDSIWLYIGGEGNVRLKEIYTQGELDGVSESFYHTGSLSSKVYYDNGIKNGPWLRFFENGDTMLSARYEDGMLHGDYISYHPGGKIQISGKYYRDLKDGDWQYFSEEGEILSELHYIRGDLQNPEELEEKYEQFIKQMEENTDNISDPALMPR